MPYKTLPGGKIAYIGNRQNDSGIIDLSSFNKQKCDYRIERVCQEPLFEHLAEIDNGIFNATVDYFRKIGSYRCAVPLTTLMISSPGEVYAGQKLDYTTDTLPIELNGWFDNSQRLFLSESSQFYLELTLLVKKLKSVFSIYNSFRKERSDATHLSEFQHIEYEGKGDLDHSKKVGFELVEYIFNHLLSHHESALLFFLEKETLERKKKLVFQGPQVVSFQEALTILYNDTQNEKYKRFSLEHFGSREEIRLTEILDANVSIEKFPMLQIPFYHEVAIESYEGVPLAENADFILSGYRETIGLGQRIKDKKVLLEKAKIFNLPSKDYLPYLKTRDCSDYEVTSGFGMGRQRLVHRVTDQPTIYESTLFPRTHLRPNP